ncbi:patched domain-containing protein 3 [Salarias fasciatus]|uniref:patched domain-containing protein 3 n=1 Tax=Salarias fasciatus TaxID=181472 RepID=UPI0011767110|nr:patched domain-containing protein 3-like [Salarias fasciatus]
MGCRRTDCLSKPLAGLFARLGATVGSYPFCFFVVPVLISLALSGGFIFLKDREDNDLERQFTPSKGPSKAARAFVMENFPYNDSMFSEDRLYSKGSFASLIAAARNGYNVLEGPVYEDITKLHRRILNITVANGTLGFQDLCARVNDECFSNVILEVIGSSESRITYPVHTHRSGPVFLGSVLGGVGVDEEGSVRSAQAVKLFYYLGNQESTAEVLDLWLRGFKALLSDTFNYKHIEVSYYTSKSKQEEIDSHTVDGFPLFLITYAIAIVFSVISCLRTDNVRNKVWVAVFGVLSAALAIVSSFGLLLYIGVPFVITVANSPFLILGIGLNNMFILVSDWQHTHVKDPVPKRMAHTYKEAVMSITITALTDVVKFSIGVKSDFPSVQSFCLYTATSIMFCYIYTITFFGAFLALNGRREEGNRHWLTCMTVPSDTDDNGLMYNVCCVGGAYDTNTEAEKKHPVSNFFKDYYGPFLIKPWVKGAVILLYVAYLMTSIYGCFQIEQGFDLQDLAADNSHVTRFTRKDRQYFSDYGPSVMVIVSESVPYWNDDARHHLQACMTEFTRLKFVHRDIYTSWLDSYLDYGHQRALDLSDKEGFLDNLSPFFDLHPLFKQDVNLTGNAIYASRFFIQTHDIANASMELAMFSELRSVADICRVASLLVYHQDFIFYDQYEVVVTSTIKNVGVIAAVMLFVSLLLIPNPLGSLWVTCSIGSVTAGVTGFKALWDVSLDSISMIIFTICIGFTVDFSAHITYAFFSSKKSSPDDKAVEALTNLGYPILQGTSSIILAVTVLAISEFNTFRTFFKLFFLVMTFGMVHGLVFIPVILTWFTCSSEKEEERKQEISVVTKI